MSECSAGLECRNDRPDSAPWRPASPLRTHGSVMLCLRTHFGERQGLYGENGGSGDPQNDYFLLNPATRTWTPELTARQLLWLQVETVLYLRPYETTPLAPGSPHRVWTSQLAVYDLAKHTDMALTSGLVLNDDLSTCS